MRSAFAALAVRNFAVLWAGSLGAFTAFFMSTVVQAIVAFELTGRNSAVGLVLVGQGLASAFLGPLGGALADRMSKKLITAICQGVITLVFFVTGLLIAFDALVLLHLVIGSFFIGASFAFLGPARQAWVVELIDLELRANAVALTMVALNFSRVVAPAVAGVLVATAFVGAAGAYFVMTALYVGVVLSLVLLPPSRPASTARDHSVLHDLVAGLAYVRGQPRLRWMLVLFYLMIVLSLSSTTVLPGLLEHELDRRVEDFGLLQSFGAIGGLGASLAVASIAGSSRALPVYTGGAVLTGLSLVLSGVSPTFFVLLGPTLLLGIGTGAFMTLNGAVIVLESEEAYYGRVISLTSLAFAGFMLAGLPVGLAADAFGERATLVVLGLLVLAAAGLVAPAIARAPSAAPSPVREPVEAAPAR